jgi:hypothetical protein
MTQNIGAIVRPFIFLLTAILSISCAAQEDGGQKQDAGAHYRAGEAHRVRAAEYLQVAVNRTQPDNVEKAHIELDRASEEYLACASTIDSRVDEATRVSWATRGLLASDNAIAALKLMLEHPNVKDDPQVLRITADALFALGTGNEAGKAYEQWIANGKCLSGYRNWSWEPPSSHPLVLLLPKWANDACAALAPELRARLETLQRLFGHPNNLPKKNFETSPRDTN